jgi:plastocyanin domain-containing protein
MQRPALLRRTPPAASYDDRVARRFVRVDAGQFDPETLHVPAGSAIRITVRRDRLSGWLDDAIVFPALGRLATLPTNEDVVVEFDALPDGRYAFSCSRGTIRGTLVVG